jgi:zinc transporter 5/7
MASSYSLPSSALPHAHHQHIHAHSQSQSSIQSWKSSASSGGGLHSHPEDESPDQDGRSSHHRQHSHGRAGSQASNTSATLSSRRGPLAALDLSNGRATELTYEGRDAITPMAGEFSTPYNRPSACNHYQGHNHSHSHGHGHDHDHHEHKHDHHHGHHHSHAHQDHEKEAKRSLFTRTILPYTARWPVVHAIMTEKDSRRIFYFMMYVIERDIRHVRTD